MSREKEIHHYAYARYVSLSNLIITVSISSFEIISILKVVSVHSWCNFVTQLRLLYDFQTQCKHVTLLTLQSLYKDVKRLIYNERRACCAKLSKSHSTSAIFETTFPPNLLPTLASVYRHWRSPNCIRPHLYLQQIFPDFPLYEYGAFSGHKTTAQTKS